MCASLDKDRDMARSILPSTYREGARRDKTAIKRARRSGVRQELRGVRRLADLDEWDGRHDLGRDTNAEIRMVVRARRSRVNLRHFER